MRVIRVLVLRIVVLSLWLAPIGAFAQTTNYPEYASVFMVEVTDEHFKGLERGTGFFLAADGSVTLTDSHVVAKAVKNPDHTHILTLWLNPSGERMYFKANLTCASSLPYDAAKSTENAPFSKDVAVLQIVPVAHGVGWPKQWGYRLPDGEFYGWSAQDVLPAFTPLTLAAHGPSSGERIKAPGYAHISALPRLFEALGEVGQSRSARDGTAIFDIHWSQPSQPGGSGSPILNKDGNVAGIWAWYDNTDHAKGTGESVEVLHHPCGDITL